MIKVLQTIGEDTNVCPCCGESHVVQEIIVERRIAAPGVLATVPARYFYCASADEFFEDYECAAFNEAQGSAINVGPVSFGFAGAPPFAAGPMPQAYSADEIDAAMRANAEGRQ